MKVEDDTIFTPYWTDKICKIFTEYTGYAVSKKQREELKKFLIKWTEENFNKILEVKKDD